VSELALRPPEEVLDAATPTADGETARCLGTPSPSRAPPGAPSSGSTGLAWRVSTHRAGLPHPWGTTSCTRKAAHVRTCTRRKQGLGARSRQEAFRLLSASPPACSPKRGGPGLAFKCVHCLLLPLSCLSWGAPCPSLLLGQRRLSTVQKTASVRPRSCLCTGQQGV